MVLYESLTRSYVSISILLKSAIYLSSSIVAAQPVPLDVQQVIYCNRPKLRLSKQRWDQFFLQLNAYINIVLDDCSESWNVAKCIFPGGVSEPLLGVTSLFAAYMMHIKANMV